MAAASGVPQFASLYVGDLHPDVTEAMLYEIFNSVGPVASIRICRDSVSRRSLGYGYVNFHSVSDAERALDTLNYSSIKGRSCRIMWSQRDPSLRKSGAGNIYVKNLDKNIDNKALYDTFSLFGNILSCKVASDPFGASYGYGFVHYETEEAAKQAIERVNGMQIGEKTVQVCQFMKRDARDTGDKEIYTNLYVKNMKPEWDDDEKLTAVFSKYGAVQSAAIRSDPKGRKFAFVNFEQPEDAKKCVEEMHLMDIRSPEEIEKAAAEGKEEDEAGPDGHPSNKLYVQRAQSKRERAAELKAKFTGSSGADVGVNLYVKNLDENIDDASLKELFEPYGNVTSVAVKKDDKGKCKGFGFVCFASPDEATKAVTEMHLKVIKGKPLYVGLAERRETRQERLRQRYQTGGAAGGKGAAGNMQGGGILPNMGGMAPPMMGKGGPLMGGGGPMMGAPMGMMGKGGPMMGMVGPRGPMMAPQMMMGMMGKGPMAMGKGGPMMSPMAMNPMAMMRPMMMPQQMMRPVAPAQAAPATGLNASALAAAPPAIQKQMIGEKLYPAIAKFQPELAGKITGMMLEMDNSELLLLLESDQQLKHKVDEALRVLQGRH